MSIRSAYSSYFEPAVLERERESLVDNLLVTMRTYARVGAHGCIWERPGAMAVYSGRPGAIFNSLLLTKSASSEEDLEEIFAWANAQYGEAGARWSLWLAEHFVTQQLLGRVGRILQPYNVALQHRSVGMSVERAQLLAPQKPLRDLSRDLQVRPIVDRAQRYDFCFVMSRAFATALPTYVDAYEPARYWEGGLKGFLAYREGRAVACACYRESQDAVGLYGVATLPEEQGRGIGESLVRWILEEAHQETGLERFVLEANERATPLYRRIGFRPIARVAVYNEVF